MEIAIGRSAQPACYPSSRWSDFKRRPPSNRRPSVRDACALCADAPSLWCSQNAILKSELLRALALVVIQLRGAGPKSGTLPVTTTLAEALFLFVRAAFIPTMTMLPPSHSAWSMPHHQHLACKKPKDALLRIVETAVEWFGGVGDLLHGGSGF